MLGEQIRTKRKSLGLSLQELADEIALNGMPITRAALSNYERGKSVPADSILNEIAKALGTSPEMLRSGNPQGVNLTLFNEPDMIAKKRDELVSYIQLCLDNQLLLDRILDHSSRFVFPETVPVTGKNTVEQIETHAIRMREQFGLGRMPVATVIGTLENNGWYVFELSGKIELKMVSGTIENGEKVFLGYGDYRSDVVLRHDILKELSKLYVKPAGKSSAAVSALAEQFASAVLLPATCAKEEFGAHRNKLSFHELTSAKQKYGLSRMKIVERLEKLGIISAEVRDEAVAGMQQTFILKQNPSREMMFFNEYPEALRMKCLRANAEGLLSEEYKDAFGFTQD